MAKLQRQWRPAVGIQTEKQRPNNLQRWCLGMQRGTATVLNFEPGLKSVGGKVENPPISYGESDVRRDADHVRYIIHRFNFSISIPFGMDAPFSDDQRTDTISRT